MNEFLKNWPFDPLGGTVEPEGPPGDPGSGGGTPL